MNLLSLFGQIKLFVFDVDGVLTDGTLTLLENGEMARKMNVKDGYALQLAVKKGYDIVIISGGVSGLVKDRLSKLGIQHIYMGIHNKKEILTQFIAENNYQLNEVLYMGDDIPDVQPMKLVGLPCAPADAVLEVKEISQFISPLAGGQGCVRDVIEKVLKLHNNWHDADNTATSS